MLFKRASKDFPGAPGGVYSLHKWIYAEIADMPTLNLSSSSRWGLRIKQVGDLPVCI